MNEFSTAEPGLQQFATTSAQDHFLQLTLSLRNGSVSANGTCKNKMVSKLNLIMEMN